ncbi:MAG: molybdopterin-binding protein [Proteobacteria bacterium]|nr:molybdopterin-binding protein [Pseudomonadota bacterium]MBU1388414.1 molybdopterin-binding protein [Pseudomonadota bacterium]MBU1542762.1 molybdopterin-binding protein [Pseudomonadota bacterium]MBU2482159.1 molybdopterin-binding protein [Pseudomonadota bacterium]
MSTPEKNTPPPKTIPLKTIPVEQGVGTHLAHDMTQIIPGEFKGPAFKKGHKITSSDVCHLMRMGKNNLYVLDLKDGQIHEDDAVMALASALAGPGVTFSGSPSEGKLELKAAYPGLFKVDVDALTRFNLCQDVMCASIHNNVSVKLNQPLAATRAIPLVISEEDLNQAVSIAKSYYPIFKVKLFNPLKVRLIITGDEVYKGLVQDRFKDIVQEKITRLGASLEESVILPDNREMITLKINEYLNKETDLIITTGGMSVDPDDVTKAAIEDSGFEQVHYSAAVLPGAMFLLGYHKDITIMGLPACGLFHKTTIFDLILPRVMAGEKPDKTDLAKLSHGGLCLNCKPCRFPACPFGKS